MKDKIYYVEIVEDETGKVVQSMGPMSKWRAGKVEDGVGINLNWDEYSTRIVDKDGKEVEDESA